MKCFIIALVAIAMSFGVANAAKPVAMLGNAAMVGDEFIQNFDRTLDPDSLYVLKGLYFVDSTYTLTIPAGTLIRGDSVTAGTLIIERGGMIDARSEA